MGIHHVEINGLARTGPLSRPAAFAAAAYVQRGATDPVLAATPAAPVDAAPVDAAPVDAAPVDAAPVDAAPAGAWFATCGARPALAFANVADALAYATGHAAPSRRRRRAVLPGETTPPSAPSHGANAPTLPRIR